jgi:uncharacterized protein (DUF2141 family)
MLRILTYLALGAGLIACAVQSQPQGGPRDQTPPVIVDQNPPMGTLNFSGNEAYVEFDEYIQSQNLRASITTSPTLEGVEAEIKGKRLRINWTPQPLQQNTTYRIALGDAIGDLNENNKFPNLELVWSSGDYIDSMRLTGTVRAEGTVAYENLKIWLVTEGTDTVQAADFVGTPEKDGTFTFTYLPTATYDLLVFEDLNFNGTWDAAAEPFGFLKSVATSQDSLAVEVPYFNSSFEVPDTMSTHFADSIQMVLDTAKPENLGHLVLIVPPVETDTYGWLSHESGYQKSFTFRPYRQADTTYIDFGNLLPGKYTFKGFVDENLDSNWTPASWFNNLPGEPIIPEQTFELKANWDLEQPLNLK